MLTLNFTGALAGLAGVTAVHDSQLTSRPVVSPASSPVVAPTRSSTDRAVAIRDYINSITLASGPQSYPSQASPRERALQWLIEDNLLVHGCVGHFGAMAVDTKPASDPIEPDPIEPRIEPSNA